jgi:hypothetical protein
MHYFSSEEKTAIRDWMKVIMKATVLRDYSKIVVSCTQYSDYPFGGCSNYEPGTSSSIREATQRGLRQDNTEQLSTRDTRVLMGFNINKAKDEQVRWDGSEEATAKADISPTSLTRTSAPPPP